MRVFLRSIPTQDTKRKPALPACSAPTISLSNHASLCPSSYRLGEPGHDCRQSVLRPPQESAGVPCQRSAGRSMGWRGQGKGGGLARHHGRCGLSLPGEFFPGLPAIRMLGSVPFRKSLSSSLDRMSCDYPLWFSTHVHQSTRIRSNLGNRSFHFVFQDDFVQWVVRFLRLWRGGSASYTADIQWRGLVICYYRGREIIIAHHTRWPTTKRIL